MRGLICMSHSELTQLEILPRMQRSLSTSLTLQYDKVLYLVEPSRENQRVPTVKYFNARVGPTQVYPGCRR